MARIRSVHPGLFTDENFMDLIAVSPLGGIFLIGIWGQADDQGAFEWKPRTLKVAILPDAACDARELLQHLIDHDFVQKYEIEGKEYGIIRNFGKYQRPKKPNAVHPVPEKWLIYAATNTKNPEPLDDKCDTGGELVENQNPTAYPKFAQMEDGGDKMKEEEESLSHVPQSASPPAKQSVEQEFERFWEAYPLKKKRGYALKAFQEARKTVSIEVLLDALARTKWRDDPLMNPHPETWLRAECWRDVEPVTMPKADAPRLQADGLDGMDGYHFHRWEKANSANFAVPLKLDGSDKALSPIERRNMMMEEIERVAPKAYQKISMSLMEQPANNAA